MAHTLWTYAVDLIARPILWAGMQHPVATIVVTFTLAIALIIWSNRHA